MERRLYNRLKTDTVCSVVVCDRENHYAEYDAVIVDICEGGMKFEVRYDGTSVMCPKIQSGDKISFQAFDEYMLYNQVHQDVFDGEALVIHEYEEMSNNAVFLGCKLIRVTQELLNYLDNKRVARFISEPSAM